MLEQNFKIQKTPSNYQSVWAQFSLLAETKENRDTILKYLKKNGIPTAIYYPKPLHLQTAFSNVIYKNNSLEVAEQISDRIFSIPMHPYLSDNEIDEICTILIKAQNEL